MFSALGLNLDNLRGLEMKAFFVLASITVLIFLFVLFPFFSLSFLGIVFLLSAIFLKFTKVKEGTAKIRTKLGSFDGVMLTKKGYIINEDGDIVLGEDKRFLSFLGGIHFVGIRFIHDVHKRDFAWTKALPNGKLEDKEEEGVDFILALVDYQYGLKVDKAEDEGFLPLDIELILTSRVLNPHNAVFRVKNWFEAIASRVIPHVREFVSSRNYVAEKTEVLPAEEIIEQLRDFLDEVERDYGVQVRKLEVSKVDPPEVFRDSTLSKFRGERKAEERSASTAGAIMSMLYQYTGIEIKDLRNEFKTNPEAASLKYAAIIESNKDMVEQVLAAEAGALKSYRFKGASGGLDLVAVLSDLFKGGGSSGGAGSSGKTGGGKKKFKDMTPEEKEKRAIEMEEEEGD